MTIINSINNDSNSNVCRIISGTGKTIGDEIALDEEKFYLIGKEKEKIKLLSKYNLYVGDSIDYKKEDNIVFDEYENAYQYCKNKYEGDYYDAYSMFDTNTEGKYIVNGCRLYSKLNYENIKQSEISKAGTFDQNEKSIWPKIGVTYMHDLDYNWGDDIDENGNLIIDKSAIASYVYGYENYLKLKGYDIENIELIKLDGLEQLLANINDKKIDLIGDWTYDDEERSEKLNIKSYIPNKYEWIYSTSYWLGSSNKISNSTIADYYILSSGYLCQKYRNCSNTSYKAGAGIRPVITVSEECITTLDNQKTVVKSNIENPKTGVFNYIIIITMFLSMVILLFITLKKDNNGLIR